VGKCCVVQLFKGLTGERIVSSLNADFDATFARDDCMRIAPCNSQQSEKTLFKTAAIWITLTAGTEHSVHWIHLAM
jgi:hypothetical protein